MTSIDLDSDNLPKIAYIGGDFELRFASAQQDGSWTIETLVTNWVNLNKEDLGITLAIDSEDLAHISYHNSLLNTLWYIKETTNGWTSPSQVDGMENILKYN